MTSSDLIIIDDLPGYRQVALLRAGLLDQIWFDDAENHPYQTGALVAVRVGQHFTQHNRATVTLGDVAGSLRLSDKHTHKPGDMVAATVTSAPRNDGFGQKPLQLREAAHISPRDLPAETGVIKSAPDALARAQAASPDASVVYDDDGSLWAQYDIDLDLEYARSPQVNLDGGGRIVISTPPGAAVIDGDSADSRLAPYALAQQMVPAVMRQLRLRRIGGPIVIDFPRLDNAGMKSVDQMMRDAARQDPLKPSLHGFTRGGLYTMARPWRDRLLGEEAISPSRALGLSAFRQIRAHRVLMRAGSLKLRIPQIGIDWMHGAGAGYYQAIMADQSFQTILIADDDIDGVQRDN